MSLRPVKQKGMSIKTDFYEPGERDIIHPVWVKMNSVKVDGSFWQRVAYGESSVLLDRRIWWLGVAAS